MCFDVELWTGNLVDSSNLSGIQLDGSGSLKIGSLARASSFFSSRRNDTAKGTLGDHYTMSFLSGIDMPSWGWYYGIRKPHRQKIVFTILKRFDIEGYKWWRVRFE